MNDQDINLNEDEATSKDCIPNPNAGEDSANVTQGHGGAIPKKKQQVEYDSLSC